MGQTVTDQLLSDVESLKEEELPKFEFNEKVGIIVVMANYYTPLVK